MLISEAVANADTRSPRQENSVSQEYGDETNGFLPVERLRRQYLDYLGGKILEIEEQKLARHYYHGSQWSAEEIRLLRARRQPIVTFNRVSRKINGIVG